MGAPTLTSGLHLGNDGEYGGSSLVQLQVLGVSAHHPWGCKNLVLQIALKLDVCCVCVCVFGLKFWSPYSKCIQPPANDLAFLDFHSFSLETKNFPAPFSLAPRVFHLFLLAQGAQGEACTCGTWASKDHPSAAIFGVGHDPRRAALGVRLPEALDS